MPIIPPPVATPPEPYSVPSAHVPDLINAPIIFEAVPALAKYPSVPELWIVVSNGDTNYGGCQVYMSIDGGASYRLVGLIAGNAATGELLSTWAAGDDPDTTNDLVVDVSESHGILEDRSNEERDQFLYPCYVEGGPAGDGITPPIPYELMSYKNAVLDDVDEYTLEATDTLRRAVYGAPVVTEGLAHTAGKRFALLSPDLVGLLKLPIPGLIGVALKFKFVAMNQFRGGAQNIADVDEYSFTPTGCGVQANQENYIQTPAEALEQPVSTFDVEMAEVEVEFAGRRVRYNARTFTVADPGIGLTEIYYVTIEDRNQRGDKGALTDLTGTCEASLDRVGVLGYTYIGSIEVTHGGGATTVTSGGGLAASSLRSQ